MENRRFPAVAGQFYKEEKGSLLRQIEGMFLGPHGPGSLPVANQTRIGKVVGVLSPHAGYVYSGYAAAAAFNAIAEDGIPDVAVILGPNHRGLGEPAAIMEQGTWETPLGAIRVDADVSACLLRSCPYLKADAFAHRLEHSIEVQAPFLQFICGDRTAIVPITMMVPPVSAAVEMARHFGAAIAEAIEGRSAIVIASTDLTHYQPKVVAQRQDARAIEAMTTLDAARLLDTVEALDISMCGAVPAAVALEACRRMGARKADLLAYYTSGDVMDHKEPVVGYAAMKFTRS